jgi:hypothetical protein
VRKERAVFIGVMLCCNDPDTGNFTGKLEGIEVSGDDGDRLMSFEKRWLDVKPSVQSDDKTWLRVGRCKYKIISYSRHVGNFCWDMALMDRTNAAKLLNDLHKSENWSLQEGYTDLWKKWYYGVRFRAQDFTISPAVGV